jgi:hypothetical protein
MVTLNTAEVGETKRRRQARQSDGVAAGFRAVIVMAAALLFAGVAASASRSVPGLTFDAPEGAQWKETVDTQSILFQQDFTNEGQKGGVLIVVGNKDGYTGDLTTGFDETAKEIALMVDQAPSQEETSVTTTGLPIRWTFKCCDVKGVGLHLTQVAIRHPRASPSACWRSFAPTLEIEEKASVLMEAVVASFRLWRRAASQAAAPAAGEPAAERALYPRQQQVRAERHGRNGPEDRSRGALFRVRWHFRAPAADPAGHVPRALPRLRHLRGEWRHAHDG